MTHGATDFGPRLRRLRQAAGFTTARQFARRLGVNENTYTRYERGFAEPSLATLARVAAALALSPGQLLGFDGEQRENGTQVRPQPQHGTARDGSEPDGRPCFAKAAWQLAAAMAATNVSDSRKGELVDLAGTAHIYQALERAPYRTIASFLLTAAGQGVPQHLDERIGGPLLRFLKLIEAREDSACHDQRRL